MRIRTIKPEFWLSEDIAKLSEPAALLAIGLLNYADDEGYFNANERLIKSALCPLRDYSRTIPVLLRELSKIGYVEVRECEGGRSYGRIVKFRDHQTINKPGKSKIRHLFESGKDYRSPTVVVQEDYRGEQGSGNRDQGTGNDPDSGESGARNSDDQPGYRTRKGRMLKGQQLEWFMQFWKAFAKPDGKADAADAWIDLKVTKELHDVILKAAAEEAKTRGALEKEGRTPKWAQGWLSGRRWEKWEETQKAKTERANSTPPDWETVGAKYGLRWAAGEMYVDFQQRVREAQRKEHEQLKAG